MNQAKQHYHYDLKSLAKSLKLSSIDVIKTSTMDIESHWFCSKGPADLYFWKMKDRLVKHQISLFNQVIEWNEYDGVKTGYVNGEESSGQGEVICFDEAVNASVVDQAIEFLQATESMDSETVNQLISHYQFYNRWQSLGVFRRLKKLFQGLFSTQSS